MTIFKPILSAFFVTIAMVKFKKMPKLYTSVILYQSKEICEKQFSVLGSREGQNGLLMHIPLCHYLNLLEIARAIQLCRCDLAWLIICKLKQTVSKTVHEFGENQHFVFRRCFSRYSSCSPMTSAGLVKLYITDF